MSPPVASGHGGDGCPSCEVHFSPHGGCEQLVVSAIESAKESVYIQAYGFTSSAIADALVKKKAAGVTVEGVFDRSDKTAKNSRVSDLKAGAIPVFIDSKHPIAHNKVLIIDRRRTETGSYNYTIQAENNAENCLVIDDAALAAAFLTNWQAHKAHSDAF